jgi:hypothetical protein
MCKAAGKLIGTFTRNALMQEVLETLATSTGIPVDVLVEVKTNGLNELRGTWVHPQVAIHLDEGD